LKNLLIVLFCFFFVSSLFAQYVEQKKEIEEMKQKTETIKDSVVTENKEKQVFLNTEKETKINYKFGKLKNIDLDLGDKYVFPMSQVYLFATYEGLKSSFEKIDFTYLGVQVLQNSKKDFLEGKHNSSVFGLGAEYSICNIKQGDVNKTKIKVEDVAIKLMIARLSDRKYWNRLVFGIGFFQSVENLTSGKYQAKQVDRGVKADIWIDLTRNKSVYFSQTNISGYIIIPVSTSKSALYDGYKADFQVYDKRMYGFNIQQTVLSFNLGGNMALNFGFDLGYQHIYDGPQDRYPVALFTEIHYKYSKIGQIMFGQKVYPADPSSKNNHERIVVNLDAWQLLRAFNLVDF